MSTDSLCLRTSKLGSRVTLIPDTSGQDALYFICKRCLDVLLALLILIVLSPLLVIIGVSILFDSPGPVLFRQQRVGTKRQARSRQTVWQVQEFSVFKFRSMIHNADQTLHQQYIKAFVDGRLDVSDSPGATFKLTNDPRVTRVGGLLRRSSLDELPQLINVLKGEMSLVGPRPVPTYEVWEYQDCHYERLAALPGITGIWQVRGRCQVPFEQMIGMDIEYVRTKSMWLDIRLLFWTVPAVLSGRGAE